MLTGNIGYHGSGSHHWAGNYKAALFQASKFVRSSPYIRPNDYGVPEDHMGADERQVRNIKLPWSEVKKTKNPPIVLFSAG